MDVQDPLRLADGRLLDWRVSGPEGGTPLVFHHGTPGASTSIRVLERAAHERGLRFVTISRPGYGSSSRRRARRVVDVVGDVEAVLGALSAPRCLVAGWSGGGPHALASGARLPGVAGVLAIASVAPYGDNGLDWLAGMGEENVAGFGAALEGEAPLRAHLEPLRPELSSITAEGIVESLATILPEVDRAALSDEFGEDMAAGFHEALRNGVDGWLDDDLAFVTDWGFALEEVIVPVTLWQGDADLMVPFAHGEWLVSQLGAAHAHLERGQGHLSIGLGAASRMIDELVAISSTV